MLRQYKASPFVNVSTLDVFPIFHWCQLLTFKSFMHLDWCVILLIIGDPSNSKALNVKHDTTSTQLLHMKETIHSVFAFTLLI